MAKTQAKNYQAWLRKRERRRAKLVFRAMQPPPEPEVFTASSVKYGYHAVNEDIDKIARKHAREWTEAVAKARVKRLR